MSKIEFLKAPASSESLPDLGLTLKTSTFWDSQPKDNQPNPIKPQNPVVEDSVKRTCGLFSYSRTGGTYSGELASFNPAAGRGVEDEALNYDSGYDNASTSSFEFHKVERAGHRPVLGPFLKPPPSKWDDAEKWLVSLSSNDGGGKNKPNGGLLQVQAVSTQATVNSTKKVNFSNQVGSQYSLHMPKASRQIHCTTELSSVTEDTLLDDNRCNLDVIPVCPPDQTFDFSGEQMKKMDTAKCSSSTGGEGPPNFAFMPGLGLSLKVKSNDPIDCYAVDKEPDDMKDVSTTHEVHGKDKYLKPILRTEKPVSDMLMSDRVTSVSISPDDPPLSPHQTASYVTPPPALRSVSMRDMGTEMTPMASQEPSRTGTPTQATTPTMRSPVSSRPSTPRRAAQASSLTQDSDVIMIMEENGKVNELSEKEMQAKTRREILALGAQLGKASIAAWASKEEEDEDASKSLKNIDLEEVKKNVLETRAAAWEEAEQAKYMARYKREEAKIQAWENHEKAKAEAEMRRMEVKVEKMRSHAHEKLMNRLATARRRAEERRAAAEAKRGEQAAKTAERADHIRRTGRVPSSFSDCGLCH